MSNSTSPMISVEGNSQVCRRPSSLILLGRLRESALTLELALQNLKHKREAVSRWLSELESTDIEFGEPRFPEQVESNPMLMAQKMANQRLQRQKHGNNQNRSILLSYVAQWPIGDKTSDEMLLFIDRIQFEAADLQAAEVDEQKGRQQGDSHAWETDPMQEVRSLMMSSMETPPDGDEIHFLFLSSLTETQYEQALAEALRDGRTKAPWRPAFGMELDQLQRRHWTASDGQHGVNDIHRRMLLPLLAETPLRTAPNQMIHETPAPPNLTSPCT